MLKNRPNCAFAVTAFALAALTATSVLAAPEIMSYQGRLTDSLGEPLDGTFSITFSIYDNPGPAIAIWTENHPAVDVSGGLFSVELGSITPLTADVFSGSNRYLGITVDGDPEILPRTQIGAVGYANRVATVDSASGGTIEGDVKINSNSVDNGLEIVQSGLGPGARIVIDNIFSTESGLTIAMQGIGAGIVITPDGGPAIEVIGGFGDQKVILPNSSIGGAEIVDGDIETIDLANDAVTTDKIDDGTITDDDISFTGISSQKLSNEPGVTQNAAGATFGITGSVASYSSTTIDAPSSGYVLVMATATATVSHTTGTTSSMVFGVSETGTSLDSDQNKEVMIISSLPSGTRRFVVSAQKVFEVTAGSHTFHASAQDTGGAGAKSVAEMTLSAVFFPTSYGSVIQ